MTRYLIITFPSGYDVLYDQAFAAHAVNDKIADVLDARRDVLSCFLHTFEPETPDDWYGCLSVIFFLDRVMPVEELDSLIVQTAKECEVLEFIRESE